MGFLCGLLVACGLSLAVTLGFGLNADVAFVVGLFFGLVCTQVGLLFDV